MGQRQIVEAGRQSYPSQARMLHAEQFFEDFLFGPLWHCSVAAAEPGHTGHSLWLEKSQLMYLLDLCQIQSMMLKFTLIPITVFMLYTIFLINNILLNSYILHCFVYIHLK